MDILPWIAKKTGGAMLFSRKTRQPILTKQRVSFIILAIAFCISGLSAVQFYRFKSHLNEMFKMNRELQEQNFYMADFEFKLLGIAYLLDKGHYRKSINLFYQYYEQLKSKKDLIKIPHFESTEAELEFYLDLQNPKTGAFMDDAYPYCVFHAPTENVLNHIDKLARQIGVPVKLKYRLHYLDKINTHETLLAYLNDVSIIGPIASKLPQTTFENARDIISLTRNPDDPRHAENLIEKLELYTFSDQWKQTLLQWFYDAQDPETGLWGPKSKSGKLLKKDLSNTASILKAFKDRKGNNLYDIFPLRYVDKLVESALTGLSKPAPPENDLDLVHSWNLNTAKSLRLMTRYIWKDMSVNAKQRACQLFKDYIRLNCEKYYIPDEGAFAYYPDSNHATLDGIGRFFIFKEIGATCPETQHRLWGTPQKTIQAREEMTMEDITESTLKSRARTYDLNSFRIYYSDPGPNELLEETKVVYYPFATPVRDIVELTLNLKDFIAATKLSMGNWISKACVQEQLNRISTPENIATVRSIGDARKTMKDHGEFIVIGFDVLQVPRYKLKIY